MHWKNEKHIFLYDSKIATPPNLKKEMNPAYNMCTHSVNIKTFKMNDA